MADRFCRAFILCDRIGRLWATRQLCLLWIFGIIIFLTNNGRLGQVYAGRFIGQSISRRELTERNGSQTD